MVKIDNLIIVVSERGRMVLVNEECGVGGDLF